FRPGGTHEGRVHARIEIETDDGGSEPPGEEPCGASEGRGEVKDGATLREAVVRGPRGQGDRRRLKPGVEEWPKERHLPLDAGGRVDVGHGTHVALIGTAHGHLLLGPRSTAFTPR